MLGFLGVCRLVYNRCVVGERHISTSGEVGILSVDVIEMGARDGSLQASSLNLACSGDGCFYFYLKGSVDEAVMPESIECLFDVEEQTSRCFAVVETVDYCVRYSEELVAARSVAARRGRLTTLSLRRYGRCRMGCGSLEMNLLKVSTGQLSPSFRRRGLEIPGGTRVKACFAGRNLLDWFIAYEYLRLKFSIACSISSVLLIGGLPAIVVEKDILVFVQLVIDFAVGDVTIVLKLKWTTKWTGLWSLVEIVARLDSDVVQPRDRPRSIIAGCLFC
ncbi:hypothetical protein TNCV_3956611 [Trichonephila clavipes]|nr:hypothetical protein TNCV_3956611 [Trichonephila clavipes]